MQKCCSHLCKNPNSLLTSRESTRDNYRRQALLSAGFTVAVRRARLLGHPDLQCSEVSWGGAVCAPRTKTNRFTGNHRALTMLPLPNHVTTGERAGRPDDNNFLPLHRETNTDVVFVFVLLCF